MWGFVPSVSSALGLTELFDLLDRNEDSWLTLQDISWFNIFFFGGLTSWEWDESQHWENWSSDGLTGGIYFPEWEGDWGFHNDLDGVLEWDYNGDGYINHADLLQLLEYWEVMEQMGFTTVDLAATIMSGWGHWYSEDLLADVESWVGLGTGGP